MGSVSGRLPHLQLERDLLACGHRIIAGLDEAGRGAWAGPVVAAAVVLPLQRPDLCCVLSGVRDSKLLTPRRREELLPVICEVAHATGVGVAPSSYVDRHGVVAATHRAMHGAIRDLGVSPDYLLIDYLHLPNTAIAQQGVPKGDRIHLSIAAASIVAKVTRDRALHELDRQYRGYGFAKHKGYGTRQHAASLAHMGPCAVHRYSFAPVRATLVR